jgi:hypothetical protein
MDMNTELEGVFDNIMALNRWGEGESRSGPGSTLLYTRNLRSQLEVFFKDFAVRSFFDAPCGDFNWMREVDFTGIGYLGGDISRALIAHNGKAYAAADRSFIDFDISVDKFPTADVWFCRDCFFHLPEASIFQALRNFCESDIKLLMMTNHINATGFENADIEAGEFRLTDFYIEPYCLPRDVLFRIADYVHPFPQREMCVWTREQVAAALAGRRGGALP